MPYIDKIDFGDGVEYEFSASGGGGSSGSVRYNSALPSLAKWKYTSFIGPVTGLSGINIWTDGDNIYYSYSSNQYVLDKNTSTWTKKTWTGLTRFDRPYIWTDGNNIYYSYSSNQYVLDKATSTWNPKTWTGLTSFSGNSIWTDGDNVYYSNGSDQYVLNKVTSTWTAKTWHGPALQILMEIKSGPMVIMFIILMVQTNMS